MKDKHSTILNFINTLRMSDKYIESIYTQGGCYQFYLVLKSIFPESIPFFNSKKDHIVTKIDDIYYDIKGVYTGATLSVLESDMKEVKSWSFSRTMFLSVKECPQCEEPMLINYKGEIISL